MAFKKLDIKGNIEKYFRENGISYDRNYLLLARRKLFWNIWDVYSQIEEELSKACVVLVKKDEVEFFFCPIKMNGFSSMTMKIGEKRFKLNKNEILSFEIKKILIAYKIRIETKDSVEVFFVEGKIFGKNWIDENVEYIKELLK
ncbi:hypothetical protein [Pseudoleptotrichia goodfellowii]|uniref:YokE-like PH domain-containing protein n=1 Tax=Pseudoleptotrichia goodfellowii TaxID=157692 RepID=A0A510J9E2_9FUSO|nr:hypothetical protein [Pseudoleptotrichia goodfellowii]BBM35774.1 hypothetical protein JCM16774_0704 [Pseudoleptotrichia goodfellowii]